MRRRREPLPSYDHEISLLFFLLSLDVFGSLGLSILLFGERFLFWEHAFSDLGNTITWQGHPNFPSRMVFSVGLVVASLLMLRIGALYAKNQELRNRVIKRWLALLGAVGFVVVIVPNNLNHVVHSVGAAIAIGVLYFFTMVFHLELKPLVSPRLFYIDLVILHVAVFSYAVTFFADFAIKQSVQKICFFGVFFALERILTVTEESFVPREVLGFLKRPQH
jgi:hypothetical protein